MIEYKRASYAEKGKMLLLALFLRLLSIFILILGHDAFSIDGVCLDASEDFISQRTSCFKRALLTIIGSISKILGKHHSFTTNTYTPA